VRLELTKTRAAEPPLSNWC